MEYAALLLGALQVISGLALYFMKNAYEDLKESVKEHDKALTIVRDTYFKKEDFREFKEELWNRLDKIEISFDKKVQELKK